MLLFMVPALLASAWKQRETLERWRSLFRPLILIGLAVLVACTIGIARVFVGVHYPGDILGGVGSGLLAASMVIALRRPLRVPTEGLLRLASSLHLA